MPLELQRLHELTNHKKNSFQGGTKFIDGRKVEESKLASVSEQAKELGVALEKTTLKLDKKKRAPTKRVKTKTSGLFIAQRFCWQNNLKGACVQYVQYQTTLNQELSTAC